LRTEEVSSGVRVKMGEKYEKKGIVFFLSFSSETSTNNRWKFMHEKEAKMLVGFFLLSSSSS
jgi:hypothetical protein